MVFVCFRRDDGHTFVKKGHVYDNRYVVPYNRLLSILLNCHINVESTSSISAVKYIYKYVYKGSDAVMAKVSSGTSTTNETHTDEIAKYLDAR